MKAVDVSVPPLPEQKAIVSVLSSLDDKIDLLHRQNKTLEAMAETLFRQWFVEEAQEDWEETPFSHFVENIKVPMTPEKLVGRKYIPIDELPMKRFGLPTARPIEEAQTSLIGFEKGDILFGAMRAYFHRVNFAPFPGVTRTTTMVLRPKKPTYFAYSLLMMNLKNSVEYADSHSAGSTMPYAVWKNSLELLPCLKPDEKTLEYFEILVDPILRKIVTNIENINTLETLRDTLLPKLMSGEVQVAV
jgi:type I restriction enzyme S subunit